MIILITADRCKLDNYKTIQKMHPTLTANENFVSHAAPFSQTHTSSMSPPLRTGGWISAAHVLSSSVGHHHHTPSQMRARLAVAVARGAMAAAEASVAVGRVAVLVAANLHHRRCRAPALGGVPTPPMRSRPSCKLPPLVPLTLTSLRVSTTLFASPVTYGLSFPHAASPPSPSASASPTETAGVCSPIYSLPLLLLCRPPLSPSVASTIMSPRYSPPLLSPFEGESLSSPTSIIMSPSVPLLLAPLAAIAHTGGDVLHASTTDVFPTDLTFLPTSLEDAVKNQGPTGGSPYFSLMVQVCARTIEYPRDKNHDLCNCCSCRRRT